MQFGLLENINAKANDLITENKHTFRAVKEALTGAPLTQIISESDFLGIRSKTKLTAKVLENSQKLLAVGCYCIGTDQVDLNAALKNGVAVFNAPYSNTRSVAELIVAEVIALSRRICDRSQKAHQGGWDKSAQGSFEVRGKTLGIVGYGHIGSQVSILAEALGMRVFYYDIIKKLPLGNARGVNDLKTLLAQSDFVTLHVPDTKTTKNMISKKEIEWMRPGSFLLNASRGEVVDLKALREGLMTKKIAGAAVDVFPTEPDSNEDVFQNDLQGLPNVILTPHIGGSTEEAQVAIAQEVTEALLNWYKTGSTLGSVNFPEINLPMPAHKHDILRIVNVHNNVPGVLKDINAVVSQFGGNIIGQAFATNDLIGYVIMDIENSKSGMLEKFNEIQNNIKTRSIELHLD